MKKILIVAAITAAGLVLWYLRPSQISPGEFKNFNVLLITLDTTRADHLPIYGYKGVETPNLSRLSQQSYLFEDALAHVPLTLPSHASILTGLLPIAHGIRDNAGSVLSEEIETLPEVLKSNGYRTGAFVSSFVLDSRWQLNQGFDLYFDAFHFDPAAQVTSEDVQRSAQATVQHATFWLEKHSNAPFFAWVHLYDPHHPYKPPEPYKTKYASNPYDGEIAYTDFAIGRLLAQLSELNIEDKTIVVVTADHGEGLGQHQEETHAMFIYDSTQRVPLLIHLPAKQHRRVSPVVRHIDLMPTILELVAIQPRADLQGSSLIADMNGDQSNHRATYLESLYPEFHFGWSALKGIVADRYKYIDAPDPELYDRVRDPGELHNVFTANRPKADELKKQLDSMIEKQNRNASSRSKHPDQETEEVLRALGYVAAGSTSTVADRTIDPKSNIHLARNLELATEKTQQGLHDAALRIAQSVLQEDPRIAEAHFISGVCNLGLRKLDNAAADFNEALRIRPGHTMTIYNLGYTHELNGNHEAAMENFIKVVKQEPSHLQANLKLAHLYHRTNQPLKARPYFRAVIERYKSYVAGATEPAAKSAYLASLAEAYFGAGDLEKAEKQYLAAIHLTPQKSNLHYNLGSIYEVQGNRDAAMKAYRKEIDLNAENYKALNNLGLLYQRSGRLEEAAVCFQRIVDLLPEERRGYLLLASVYKEMGRTREAEAMLRKIK